MANDPVNRADSGDRLARIERMIDQYRRAKKGRQQRRAIALWRKLQSREALARFEQPLERIH